MNKTYAPAEIEVNWYKKWEENNYFAPSGQGEPYSIVIPPPNVTGSLHMGHAFQDTIMDCLIRYQRMLGKNTLWQPGTDHAGIATQMVVERKLEREEGKKKGDLGRDKFIEKIWQWKEESGGNISKQLRRMGASADWSRERFTMDEGLSAAVSDVFIKLHEDGLIYRGQRLVNWDPVLKTAISDLEVLNEEEDGHMYHVRYPFVDENETFGGGYMHIATTRPETILADGCLAVHPDDERYKGVIGKMVQVPMTDRVIPIVTDEYPDPEFGTGCVKITPAHDFNDYEVGLRVGCEVINLFTPDAYMNENAPTRYQGMERFDARKAIVADLEAAGLLEKVEKHTLKRPRGDRTGAVIEPYLTEQWYVKADVLAKEAIKVVEDGRVKFVPKQYENMYFSWMRDIQDWCISRQLWWGHRIPAWYDQDNNAYVGKSEADVRAKYNLLPEVQLRQDDDVLDTWFSSALWSFSTLGWPEQNEILKTFHPTSVLVTGFDIIFFWVARMIMMSLYFLKNTDGSPQVPFHTVYVTGLIRDEQGNKMSKSKGNVLDPLDMIDGISLEALLAKRTSSMMNPQDAEKIAKRTEKQFPNGIEPHGTDALRFTLAALASTGRDINWDMNRLEGYRNFCNKIWNAARFVLMKTEDFSIADDYTLSPYDKWVLAELNKTVGEVHQAFSQYRFDALAKTIYEFVWNTYCDWYLELSKSTLNSDDIKVVRGTQRTLLRVLEQIMRLTHPLMPFLTEEIWQQLKAPLNLTNDSVMLSSYPQVDNSLDYDCEAEVAWVQGVLTAVRKIRSEMNIAPSKQIPLLIEPTANNSSLMTYVRHHQDTLKKLGRIDSIDILSGQAPESAVALVSDCKVHIPLAGLIDKAAELGRLDKEIAKLQQSIERLDGQLNNANYIDRAPAHLVEQTKSQRNEQQVNLDELCQQRQKIELI